MERHYRKSDDRHRITNNIMIRVSPQGGTLIFCGRAEITYIMFGKQYKTLSGIERAVKIMIKVRLHGTKDEIDKAISYLELVMGFYSVSGYYKDRGNSQYYRVYIDGEVIEITNG